MKSQEQIKNEIARLEQSIKQVYANFADHFEDAKYGNPISKKDLPYFENGDNIEDLLFLDDALEQGLVEPDDLNDDWIFLDRLIRFKKHKKKLYFINPESGDYFIGRFEEELASKDIDHLENQILMLKEFLNYKA